MQTGQKESVNSLSGLSAALVVSPSLDVIPHGSFSIPNLITDNNERLTGLFRFLVFFVHVLRRRDARAVILKRVVGLNRDDDIIVRIAVLKQGDQFVDFQGFLYVLETFVLSDFAFVTNPRSAPRVSGFASHMTHFMLRPK